MPKDKYDVKPLSELLQSYIAKNYELFKQPEIENLPESIKESVNIEIEKEKQKQNDIFVNKAFKDLEAYHNKLPYSKKFDYTTYDIIYFMYKLRDNKDIVINSGYKKYSFVLELINGSNPYDDVVYKLIITEIETDKFGIYETIVGRFD